MPCSHPAFSKFCVHLEFLPEIVCKVEKVRSTFHDYLNFYGEKKDDRLFTIYQWKNPKVTNIQQLFAEWEDDGIRHQELDWGKAEGEEQKN